MSVYDNKLQNNNRLCCENIKKHLSNNATVHFFDSIDSTNNEAKRRSDKLSDTPVLFVANHQHSGRGRLGRTFYSPKDTGLYMSLMLKQSDGFENIVCMTTAAAVCVCDAIRKLCDLNPKIKWVNDIYIENKKVCGILCEAITNPDTTEIDGIIIGIGINISTTDFPEELCDTATSLTKDIDKSRLCAVVTDNLIDMQKNISDKSFIDKYKAYSLVLQKEITYTENGITKEATAIDIDKDGSLVIKTIDGIKKLSTGEITVRVKK